MTKKTILFIGVSLVVVFSVWIISRSGPIEVKTEPAPVPVAKKTVRNPPLKPVAIENPHLQKFLDEYESEISRLLELSHTPGASIAIVRDSSIIYLKGFGVKATGTSDSVNSETVFRLASVSKCFAPVLTGMLIEDSLMHWDDKVIRYVPDFALKSPEQTAELNIKHILSHTMGLPYHTYTNLIEEGDDLHSMLAKLRDVNMINKVGKVYSYQNVAYSLISEVVQAASGKSYEQLMAERVFKPLGMEHASICYDSIKKNDNVALPHRYTRKGLRTTPILSTYYNAAPAGGINASVSDMARWITALLGHRTSIVSENILNEVFTPVIRAPYKNRNFRKWLRPTGSFYALGWRVLNFKDETLFYHGGYVNGYRSELAIDRKENIGVCVLTNLPGALADNAVPLFYKLYESHRDSIQSWDQRQRLLVRANIN
jgi:beta-lactamase class C